MAPLVAKGLLNADCSPPPAVKLNDVEAPPLPNDDVPGCAASGFDAPAPNCGTGVVSRDPPKLKGVLAAAGVLVPAGLAKMLACGLAGSSWLAGVPPNRGLGVGAALTAPKIFLVSGAGLGFAPNIDGVDWLVVAPNSGLGASAVDVADDGAVVAPNNDLGASAVDVVDEGAVVAPNSGLGASVVDAADDGAADVPNSGLGASVVVDGAAADEPKILPLGLGVEALAKIEGVGVSEAAGSGDLAAGAPNSGFG